MKFQRIAIASLVVVAAGLTACSSTARNSAGSTTSVTGSTTPDVVSSTETTAPPTVPPTAPPDTPAPTTPPVGYSLYDQVDSPSVPTGHTDGFADVLADGVYWVVYNGGETFTPDITVYVAYFGQECIDMAAAAGEECLNDIYVPDPPSLDLNDLPFADDVFLTIAAFDTQLSYWITPDELRTIRAGSPTVDTAPSGVFASFPFLMTVQSGRITKFEQVWTP